MAPGIWRSWSRHRASAPRTINRATDGDTLLPAVGSGDSRRSKWPEGGRVGARGQGGSGTLDRRRKSATPGGN